MPISILIPIIGLVLGHPHKISLEPQYIRIVYMFTQQKLNIQLPEEIQWQFLVVQWWNIKNHIPYIHPMIQEWLICAPLNQNIYFVGVWNLICSKHFEMLIYFLFCDFQLLDFVVTQAIFIFLLFSFSMQCYVVQCTIRVASNFYNSIQ